LASDFTVYEYDRRGRGSSGDTPPYSVRREIKDLDALITHAGGSARVYGHSSGGVLALAAAAESRPITKLAVYEPPFIVDDTRIRPPADLADRLTELVASGHREDAVKLFWSEAVQMPPDVIAMLEASPMWPTAKALAHTIPYDLTICGPGNRMPADQMASIPIPTLALDGGASPEWARNAVRAVAAAVPGAHQTTLDGQAHRAADAVLAPVLLKFFS
jgi:pimeloyl-ACP methyl ester carboxylesterase